MSSNCAYCERTSESMDVFPKSLGGEVFTGIAVQKCNNDFSKLKQKFLT